MTDIVQTNGSLVKWIPEIPDRCTVVDARLQLLEIRRVIMDRAFSWEEMEALALIHAATITQLDEQLSACEHSKSWQVAKWKGERAKSAAVYRKCLGVMRQYELEVLAWADKFRELVGRTPTEKVAERG